MIDNERYFDNNYIEVDRILSSTDMFPIIHPKKANEIKGKWTENLVTLVLKVVNFIKDEINFGIYFLSPCEENKLINSLDF